MGDGRHCKHGLHVAEGCAICFGSDSKTWRGTYIDLAYTLARDNEPDWMRSTPVVVLPAADFDALTQALADAKAVTKRHDDVHCWLDKTPVPTHNHHDEKFTLLGRVNLLFDWYCDMKAERDTLRAENATLRAELAKWYSMTQGSLHIPTQALRKDYEINAD